MERGGGVFTVFLYGVIYPIVYLVGPIVFVCGVIYPTVFLYGANDALRIFAKNVQLEMPNLTQNNWEWLSDRHLLSRPGQMMIRFPDDNGTATLHVNGQEVTLT